MKSFQHPGDGPKARRARGAVVAVWLVMIGVIIGALMATVFGDGPWHLFAIIAASACGYAALALFNVVIESAADRRDQRAAAAEFVAPKPGEHGQN